MDYQVLFNIVLGAFGALAMVMINNLHKKIDSLSTEDRALMLKVGALEVLIVGQFVKRSEFDAKLDAMSLKLDQIDEKLDRRLATRLSDQRA